jgi:alpha-L-rhamnosidase
MGGDDDCPRNERRWITAVHAGYDSRSPRMSCQHGFFERVDAGLCDEDCTSETTLPEGWDQAKIIGKPGDEPWPVLKQSPIPPLTEEPVWPVRVESLKQVRAVSWTTCLDIRNAMLPESIRHANPVFFIERRAVFAEASESLIKALTSIYGRRSGRRI